MQVAIDGAPKLPRSSAIKMAAIASGATALVADATGMPAATPRVTTAGPRLCAHEVIRERRNGPESSAVRVAVEAAARIADAARASADHNACTWRTTEPQSCLEAAPPNGGYGKV